MIKIIIVGLLGAIYGGIAIHALEQETKISDFWEILAGIILTPWCTIFEYFWRKFRLCTKKNAIKEQVLHAFDFDYHYLTDNIVFINDPKARNFMNRRYFARIKQEAD